MGFLGVAMFVVNCFDVLAWPLCALVYPLCASIRAIELDSSSDTRKLVAYWVLFALLFLFEYSFANFLEWIPFWLYIKLIVSCSLVIPNFDGAFYVYKHFLCPCLYMDTEVLINQLKNRKEFFFKRNEFDSNQVKRCVKENGPKASEKLVAGKVKLQMANLVQKDVKTVEVIEKKDETAAKKVDPTKPYLAQMENNNFALKKIQEISESVPSNSDYPEVPVFPDRFLCQMAAESETTWNSHLQQLQSKKVACEANNQPSKTKVVPASEDERSGMPVQGPANNASVAPASEDQKFGIPVQGPENNAGSSKRDQKLQQEIMKNKYVEHRGTDKWRCTICNASCNSLNDINCHLGRRKHLTKVQTTEPDLSHLENNNFAPKKIQEISESVPSNSDYPEVPVFPDKFLCQMAAESETTWNSHLQQRQSKKAACEAKNQPSKTKVVAASEDKRSGMPVQGPENYASVAPASEDKKFGIPVQGPENNAGSSKRDQKLQQEIMKNKYVEHRGTDKWRCTICNVSCNSLNDFNCHLGGRKHLAKVQTTEPDLSNLENNNFAPKKSQEISESVPSNSVYPEVPVFPDKFLCQMAAESETTWNSHLQQPQSKKAACEAKNQPSKTQVVPASEDKRSGMPVQGPENNASVAPASEDKKFGIPVQGPENNAGSSKRDQKLQQEIMKNKYVEHRGTDKWRCTICNASFNSLNDINCHLGGRKHLAKVQTTEPDLSHLENNKFAPKKIQEISESEVLNTEYPQVPVFPKKFEKRKCPLCQVTAESETTWNSHLQGQRHVAALETLKAKKLQSKKASCEAKNQPSKTKVVPASEDERSGMPVQWPENNAGSSKRDDQKLQEEIMKNTYVELGGANKWRCTICKANCNSLIDINSHLKGSRHLANIG